MSDRIPGSSWYNPIWHGQWRIYINSDWPYDQFTYCGVHDDYDGAPDAHDSRVVYGRTIEECKIEINNYEEDNADGPSFPAPIRNPDEDASSR